jgi:hypothetical protein
VGMLRDSRALSCFGSNGEDLFQPVIYK